MRVGFEGLAEFDAEAVMRAIRSDLRPVNAASRDLLSAAGEDVEARLEKVGVILIGGLIEPEIAARALVQTLFGHCDEGQPPLDLRIAASSPF